jgi:hypothetical protein
MLFHEHEKIWIKFYIFFIKTLRLYYTNKCYIICSISKKYFVSKNPNYENINIIVVIICQNNNKSLILL